MLKLNNFFYSLFLVCFLAPVVGFAADETLTITTYYPSPYGSYNQMNIGVGSTTAYAKLTVSEFNESTTQTNFNQTLVNSGINIETEYTANAFTPGIFWSTNNNSVNRPKAGIYLKETGTGTFMHLGTSNSYATGITNDGLVIDPSGYLGIGTTAPAVRLDIAGDVNLNNQALSAAGTVNRGYYVYKSGTTAYGMKLQYTGAEYGTLVFGPNQASRFINFGKIGAALEDDNVVEYARIDLDNGNVGIGTTNPAAKLDISGGYATASLPAPVDIRNLRFASGGTSPDAAQIIWGDNTGWKLHFGTRDSSANFVPRVTFMATGPVGIGTTSPVAGLDIKSSSDGATCLRMLQQNSDSAGWSMSAANDGNLKIFRSDATSRYVVINYAEGNVGIGTTSPACALHVVDGSGWNDGIRLEYNPSYITKFVRDTTYFYIVDGSNNGVRLANGATAWVATSDIRLKKNVEAIDGALDKIMSIRGVYFNWKDEKALQSRQVGVIGQEVEKLYPEIVSTDKDGYISVAYSMFTPYLIEAIKEQQKEIKDHGRWIEEQQKQIDRQQKEIDGLKSQLKR